MASNINPNIDNEPTVHNYGEPDFHYSDFDGKDFNVGKPKTSEPWFFKFLPPYFKMNDTYKDAQGQGLLERYLSAFDPEVLLETFPNINKYLDIIDVRTCAPKFLTHISDVLGNPPDIFDDEDKYRNLLAYIVSVYKIKGSIESYELFFDILGFDIELEEIPLFNQNSVYDNEGIFDSDEFESIYDKNGCPSCSYYDLTLYYKDVNNFTINQEMINNIREAITFNEPINAKLRRLTIGFRIVDKLDIIITEEGPSQEELTPARYDVGNDYDGDLIYEKP